MGLLRKGEWSTDWYDTDENDGEFVRDKARFRGWITADGSPGPDGQSGFRAESGRYHLYVAYACPWAHRTLIYRNLKGLKDHISLSVVDPEMLDEGWTFSNRFELNHDPVNGAKRLYEVYQKAKSDYTGRVTTPTLWDRETETIVSNESADIIRMFNSAFDQLTGNSDDYCPDALLHGIDRVNEEVYHHINNGVYRSGFATSQEAYEKACRSLFEHLEILERQLQRRRYLLGDRVTEADWRLFPTLIRFDAVYHGHFKCNLKRIADYPNLFNYMLELYQWPGIADTVFMDQIKRHYYYSHDRINPTRVVPLGPIQDLDQAHDRNRDYD